MITEEGSKGKGKLVKSAHGLARAVEDAISAKDAVVATVVSVGDKWRLNGRIQCRIGTMGLVEVTCRGVEDVQIDDSILVRKVGRGPTSRWIFVGWHWGMREGAGELGTMIPTVRLDSIPPHAATHQDAGADEINVGGLSGDLADAQDPKAHASSHQDGGSDEINVAGLSGDLADAQDAKAHASSHQDGGGDEISVQGLSGDLADAQDAKSHASTHQNGGADEISVAGLSGVLADDQDADKIKGVDVIDTAIGDGKVLVYRTASGDLGYEAQAGGGGAAWGQVVTVMKSGGDYTDLTSAMAAITDASATKPYTVFVGPGLYEFDQYIPCKPWVSVVGMGIRATIFKPTGVYSDALRIKLASHAQYMDFSIINLAVSNSGTDLLWGLELDEIEGVRVTNVQVEYGITTTGQAEVGGIVVSAHDVADVVIDHCVSKVTHTTGTTLSRTYAIAVWGGGVLLKDSYGYAASAGYDSFCAGIDLSLKTPASGTNEITAMGCIGEASSSTSSGAMGIKGAVDRSTGAGASVIRVVDCIGRSTKYGGGFGTVGSTGGGVVSVIGGEYEGTTKDIALYDGAVLANEPTAYPKFYAVQYASSYADRLPIYLAGDRLAGKLDWDDAWADAVHNHSSDAEGGNTLSLSSLGVTNNITVGGTVDGVDVGDHVAAAAPHSGHVQIGGQLGGTPASPDVRGLRESGGQLLTMGAVESRKYLQRSESGNTIIGGAPVLYAQSEFQQEGFATDTYLDGSAIAIPPGYSLLNGTRYHLLFDVSKTAAGTATPIIRVRFGTNATTADAAVLTFTFLAQTAAADKGTFEVWSTFREGGSANEILQGVAQIRHRLQITGLQNLVCTTLAITSAAFDSTVANSFIGASLNAGTSAVWTIELVQAELENLR